MGDAGSMSVAAQDTLTGAGVQTITGAKTFNNQKLLLRNPADTFTGTWLNPILTANKNLEVGFPSFGNYIVYRDAAGNYVAKNLSTHAIDFSGSSSTSPETAIQTAITNAGLYGTIMIPGFTTFPVSSSFTGFNMSYHQDLWMGHGTRISLPTGYTGSVFIMNQANNAQQVQIHGGMIQELTTPSKLWTAFEINSNTTTGVWNIHIDGTRVYAAGKGIALKTDTNGWSNGNIFNGMFFDACNIAISFEHTGTFTAFLSGVNNCQFSNIIHQAVASTTHGIKDVNGRRNYFLNDYIADFTGGQITMNITANAASTQIEGGTCTAVNFADLSPASTPTIISDAFSNDVKYIRKTWNYEDGVAISAPSSPSTGTVRQYTKTVDSNNDGKFYKARINGAVVEVQI